MTASVLCVFGLSLCIISMALLVVHMGGLVGRYGGVEAMPPLVLRYPGGGVHLIAKDPVVSLT